MRVDGLRWKQECVKYRGFSVSSVVGMSLRKLYLGYIAGGVKRIKNIEFVI